MGITEEYLEQLQQLYDSYRRGLLSRDELEVKRLQLSKPHAAVNSRGSLVLAAAFCSLLLVATLGFARVGFFL